MTPVLDVGGGIIISVLDVDGSIMTNGLDIGGIIIPVVDVSGGTMMPEVEMGGGTIEVVGMTEVVGSLGGLEVGDCISVVVTVTPVVVDCTPIVVVSELELEQSTNPPKHPMMPPKPVLELLVVVEDEDVWLGGAVVVSGLGDVVSVFCIRLNSEPWAPTEASAGPSAETQKTFNAPVEV